MDGSLPEDRPLHTPPVTVGVPVYNGAQWLEASLACLRDQTFRDIEVLIYDNCSDDATPEIAKAFCAEDARFRYFRQPENKGPKRNFLDVLQAARSPYFMWRAADDTSDLNYIEVLLELLRAHPERDLAAPRTIGVMPDGSVKADNPVPSPIENGQAVGRWTQLSLLNAGWIYGMFRRQTMLRILAQVIEDYPYVSGWDVVALIPFSFDGKIIGSNNTAWYGYLRYPAPSPNYRQRAVRDVAKIERLTSVVNYAHRHVDRVIEGRMENAYYHLVIWYYGFTRGLTFTKRIRKKLNQAIGIAPALSSQKES
ncbi:MAG: glycosyltransferase family 2 protein [Rhodomicrobium sp.]